MKRSRQTHGKKTTPEDKSHQILMSVLTQVPFDGWTAAAYERGIRQCGLSPGEADLLFPRGIRDVVELFGEATDEAMFAKIENKSGFDKLRVREKIAFAIRARLEFLTPHREAMRQLMTWYALPFHWSLGAKRIYQTVDLAWRAAGDSSTDFNFYTKRGLLAGVVKATILFWLDDETPGCKASWEFLDRRIEDVMSVGQIIGRLRA